MRKWIFSAVIAAAVAGGAMSRGMFMNASVKMPVDRAVGNVEAWIKEKPQDAQAYYVLGRIHSMAWAYGPNLNLWGNPMGRGKDPATNAAGNADPFDGKLPGFAPYDSVEVRRDEAKKDATAEDMKHLEASIENYKKAVELAPKEALYELGLAWMLQEAGKVALNLPEGFLGTKVEVTAEEKAKYAAAISKLSNEDPAVREAATAELREAMPKALGQLKGTRNDNLEAMTRMQNIIRGYWELQALEHYRKAYDLRIDEDLKRGGGLRAGDSALAEEAGDAILGILKDQPQAAKPDEAKKVAENVKKLKAMPMAVTPVIFAMPGVKGDVVGDLVDSSKRVGFDLAGDQVARTWPWVKDGTALLVWDPAETGKITNGRQLFGDHTWWIFFRDGYEALSILDDNRDGELTGAELAGISVWVDKNGDGVSQAGEVMTVAQAGIVGIGVKASDVEGTLTSGAGIRFKNGETVRSFDWVTMPVSEGETHR